MYTRAVIVGGQHQDRPALGVSDIVLVHGICNPPIY